MKVANGKKYIETSDFESYTSLESLINSLGGVNSKDASGMSPLCFAILNQVDPIYIVLLCTDKNLHPVSDSNDLWLKHTGFGADISVTCKGKSPLQYAIMSCSTTSIKILFGERCVTVDKVNSEGFLVIKYKNNMPVFTVDNDGNESFEFETMDIGINRSDNSKWPKVDDGIIFETASNPNADVLKLILDKYTTKDNKPAYAYDRTYDIVFGEKEKTESGEGETDSVEEKSKPFTIMATGKKFNEYNYTPLMMATSAQNYDSIIAILDNVRKDIKEGDTIPPAYIAINEKHNKIMDDDSTVQSAFDIAQINNDTDCIKIFESYYNKDVYLYASTFITYDADEEEYTAKDIEEDIEDSIIPRDKLEEYLNALHSLNLLVLDIDGEEVNNAEHNKDYICIGVKNNEIDDSKLKGWPWWGGDIKPSDIDKELGTIAFMTDTFSVDDDPGTLQVVIDGTLKTLSVEGEWEDTNRVDKGYNRCSVPFPPFPLIYDTGN